MLTFMMSPKTWGWIIAIILAVILLFIGFLTTTKNAQTPQQTATTTVSTPPPPAPQPKSTKDPNQPLSAKVSVTAPVENATVSHAFTVSGKAPGPWFFEAQFPVQVRDPSGKVVGRATGKAKGDWMTTKLVAFEAIMQVDGNYHGPATLILMKDNPSGLPENDDSVTIPITVE
jgi:hypothetical protein